jgi:hypothetical protein
MTLVRQVNANAFVSGTQTRPYPSFGRPVRLGGCPHQLRPCTSPHAFQIPSRDDHPGFRSTDEQWLPVGLGCLQLSPSCPFRRLHTFAFSGQRGCQRRFWIWRPSFERQRDFTPPEQRSAQRTFPSGRRFVQNLRIRCALTNGENDLSHKRHVIISS